MLLEMQPRGTPTQGTKTKDSSYVDIVVVVPVFRHSVFVADAVDSALAQQTGLALRIVIVDDGCPHASTRRIALALATAFPDRVDYIRQKNAGLSAARNAGVDYALHRWPSVGAFYFLDADNMIEPRALDRACAALKASPDVGWVYPDIAMFGSRYDYLDYSGPYSVLKHLLINVSEAGSLVHRDVFERGCRFDESMRQGFEDWEFWWQCIEAGFVGCHVPLFGLRYRKRPESMLSQSERDGPEIRSYMRRKHEALFRVKRLLAFEAAEAPRYGLILPDCVRFCTDVRDAGETIEPHNAVNRILAAFSEPHSYVAARLLVAASSVSLELLKRIRVDRFALWWMESRLLNDETQMAAITIVVAPSQSIGIAVEESESDGWLDGDEDFHLISMKHQTLKACLEDKDKKWVRSVLTQNTCLKIAKLRIQISPDPNSEERCANVIYRWLDFFNQLHTAYDRDSSKPRSGKSRTLVPFWELGAIPSKIHDCGPLFPLGDADARDVAFILPIVAFGGVEKVALAIARQFRAKGWRCHLILLAPGGAVDEAWLSVFDNIVFVDEESFYKYNGPGVDFAQKTDRQQFFGTWYPTWNASGDGRALEGLLLPMDAVINFHSGALHKIISKLRQAGAVTVSSLHLVDISPYGREVGHPFLTLGYEHVYDLIAPCSQKLLDWCHGMGVPMEKLVLVPNSPGYDLSRPTAEEILRHRAADRTDSRELHVLFLGRLDRQKGLDRLAATVVKCRDTGLALRWRIVGGGVVEAAETLLGEALKNLVEPPAWHEHALTELYEWADVLFLPSHWEGLPLTVLEAARLGVVPVAADVGAVSEVIEDGTTGVLLEDTNCEKFAAAAAAALRRLVTDRSLLCRLSLGAAAAMNRTWEVGARELIAQVDRLVARKQRWDSREPSQPDRQAES